MKSLLEKIWNVILILLVLICILPFSVICIVAAPLMLLWELLGTPYHIRKYKKSAYYQDLQLKYSFNLRNSWHYKLYNQIQAAGLPIGYVPEYTFGKPRHFGYFIYGNTLLDLQNDAYYDEDEQSWLCMIEHDKEANIEKVHADILASVAENTSSTAYTKVITVMSKREMSNEEIELAVASPLFLLYDGNDPLEALKAFLDQEAQHEL